MCSLSFVGCLLTVVYCCLLAFIVRCVSAVVGCGLSSCVVRCLFSLYVICSLLFVA